jgi:copper chaperone CopZ
MVASVSAVLANSFWGRLLGRADGVAEAPAAPPEEVEAAPTKLVLQVPDMHCEGCARTIQDALGSLEGVTDAAADPGTQEVRVQWDGGAEAGERIAGVLASAGFRVERTEYGDAE